MISQPCGHESGPRCCWCSASGCCGVCRSALQDRYTQYCSSQIQSSLSYKLPPKTLKHKISHEQPADRLRTPQPHIAKKKVAAGCRRTSEEKPPTERAQAAHPTTSRHQCIALPPLPGLRACGSPVPVQRQPFVPPIRACRASKSRPGEPAFLPVRRAD